MTSALTVRSALYMRNPPTAPKMSAMSAMRTPRNQTKAKPPAKAKIENRPPTKRLRIAPRIARMAMTKPRILASMLTLTGGFAANGGSVRAFAMLVQYLLLGFEYMPAHDTACAEALWGTGVVQSRA